MRNLIRNKPWLIVVAGLVGFTLLDMVFLFIAFSSQPQMLP